MNVKWDGLYDFFKRSGEASSRSFLHEDVYRLNPQYCSSLALHLQANAFRVPPLGLMCLLHSSQGSTAVHLRRFRTFLVNGETQGPSDLPALARG
jgi:hypothetical protein